MAHRITLGRGAYSALVDDADAQLVAGYRWFRHHNGHGGYYARGYPQGARRPFRYVYMHILIGGRGCDHINRDGLDNQRANLRTATGSQNLANTSSRGGTSPYKGVYWSRAADKWVAAITVSYRSRYLGCFADEAEAARAYDAAALRAWGEFARLNFP